jgi:helicase HerA-like protein
LANLLVDDRLFVGVSTRPEYLLLKYANRHGLITGATGTGKTVTLQGLAEGFSRAGIPVFLADVKGDPAGLSQQGEATQRAQEQATRAPPRPTYDERPPRRSSPAPRHSSRASVGEAVIKSVARNVTGQLTRSVTRQLVRGIVGSIAKGL